MDKSEFAFRDAVNAAQTAIDDAGIETHKNKKFHGTLYEIRARRGATQKQGDLEDAILGILRAAEGVEVIRVSTNFFSIMFEVKEGIVSPLETLTDGDINKDMLVIKKLNKNYDMRQKTNNKRPLSEQDDEEAVAGPLQEGD